MIIRAMKGLGHVGVGLEAPNGLQLLKTDFYIQTHTGKQVTDFRSFPLGQNS